MKICTKCKISKQLSEYNKEKSRKDGLTTHCKSCLKIKDQKWYKTNIDSIKNKKQMPIMKSYHKTQSTKWRKTNPDKIRNTMLQHRYKITSDQYENMLISQNYVCFICKNPETGRSSSGNNIKYLAVDHCHKTGKVRGLLCSECNRALAGFKDNPKFCHAAGDYLTLHGHSSPEDHSDNYSPPLDGLAAKES